MEFNGLAKQFEKIKNNAKPVHLVTLGLIVFFLILPQMLHSLFSVNNAVVASTTVQLPPKTEEQQHATTPQHEWRTIKIEKGDSISEIFHREGIKPQVLNDIKKMKKVSELLKRLQLGQEIKIEFDANLEMKTLIFPISTSEKLVVYRSEDNFSSYIEKQKLYSRTRYALATVESSVYQAGLDAKLSPKILRELAHIFAWQIDFSKDVRPGDRFTLVYNDYYLNDKKVETGEIIAAEFINRGKRYTAIRHRDNRGHISYYDENGRNLERAFLRYPVKFTHISSPFDLKRKHPILKIVRPHKGIDYAAPIGTPIRAAGDGKIIYLGRKGGYGKMVKIRHDHRYATVYAHLFRYQKGLQNGSRIKRGDIIGFVGQSGLASGPHLHYEFHVNSKPVDPLTVKIPLAKSIAQYEIQQFRTRANTLMAQLDLFTNSKLAANSRTLTDTQLQPL